MVQLLKSSRPMRHGSIPFITGSRRCWRFYKESQRRCPSTARQVWLWRGPHQKSVGLHSRSLLQIRLLLACQDILILVTFSTPPNLHCLFPIHLMFNWTRTANLLACNQTNVDAKLHHRGKASKVRRLGRTKCATAATSTTRNVLHFNII